MAKYKRLSHASERRRTLWIIVAVCIVIFLLGGVGGTWLWESQQDGDCAGCEELVDVRESTSLPDVGLLDVGTTLKHKE